MSTDTCVLTEGSRAPESVSGSYKEKRSVDLASIPWNVPQALLNEFQAAAVINQSVKVLRRRRGNGSGPRFIKLGGATIRYRLGDLLAWVEAQPTGGGQQPGGRRGPGRPRGATV